LNYDKTKLFKPFGITLNLALAFQKLVAAHFSDHQFSEFTVHTVMPFDETNQSLQLFESPKLVLHRFSLSSLNKQIIKEKDLKRYRLFAALLALECTNDSRLRSELSFSIPDLVDIMIEGHTDTFIMECCTRCMCLLVIDIFDKDGFETARVHTLVFDVSILEALMLASSRIIESSTKDDFCTIPSEDYSARNETLADSICSALERIFNATRYCCSLEHCLLLSLFSRLEEHGVLSKLFQWTTLGHDASSQDLLRTISQMAINAITTLHELAFKSDNETVMQMWFQSIQKHRLLFLLLDANRHKETSTDFQASTSKLTTDIIAMMIQFSSKDYDTLFHRILESIATDIYSTLEPFYQFYTPQLDGEDLLHALEFFHCCHSMKYFREKKDDPSYKRKISFKMEPLIRAEFVVTLTWALIHRFEPIANAATACFQDIFILSSSFCLSQSEVIRLLESSFVHVIMVVREVLRGKRELHKNTTLAMDQAFSFISMSLAQHARNSGNLLPLVQGVNSRETFNEIVLEGLFLMHREQTRLESESSRWEFWTLFEVTTPWDNPQQMYSLSKCIMRISNLLCTTKIRGKGPDLNPSKLWSMRNDQELFIELLCADKACPIIIRCPPIDLIVDSAPLLGTQVRVGIDTASSIFLCICNIVSTHLIPDL